MGLQRKLKIDNGKKDKKCIVFLYNRALKILYNGELLLI